MRRKYDINASIESIAWVAQAPGYSRWVEYMAAEALHHGIAQIAQNIAGGGTAESAAEVAKDSVDYLIRHSRGELVKEWVKAESPHKDDFESYEEMISADLSDLMIQKMQACLDQLGEFKQKIRMSEECSPVLDFLNDTYRDHENYEDFLKTYLVVKGVGGESFKSGTLMPLDPGSQEEGELIMEWLAQTDGLCNTVRSKLWARALTLGAGEHTPASLMIRVDFRGIGDQLKRPLDAEKHDLVLLGQKLETSRVTARAIGDAYEGDDLGAAAEFMQCRYGNDMLRLMHEVRGEEVVMTPTQFSALLETLKFRVEQDGVEGITKHEVDILGQQRMLEMVHRELLEVYAEVMHPALFRGYESAMTVIRENASTDAQKAISRQQNCY